MSVHNYRVRRNTQKGPTVVGFFRNMEVALRLARKRMRETGNLFRVERRTQKGWETALELAPDVSTPIERLIARGHLPGVQATASGRKGRVLSYVAPTREARVAWLDVETPGRGELVHVDGLELR